MRAQAEVPSARMPETPTFVALADVASASNGSTRTYFGGADEWHLVLP
jgi:hypothetical protein